MARKSAITNPVRIEIAKRHGCLEPEDRVRVDCHYGCGCHGYAYWTPQSTWVIFPGLELDHLVPEQLGGETTAENLVLACRPCNRGKGWRHSAEEWAEYIRDQKPVHYVEPRWRA